MSIPRSWLCAALLGLGLAAFLPWVGQQVRSHAPDRCVLDGVAIANAMRVRILSRSGDAQVFCSLRCAERWLQISHEQPEAILLTDEATGDEFPANHAVFVRSQVVAHIATREHRHVFRLNEDARSHADSHFGRILEGDARPFSKWLDRHAPPVAKQIKTPNTFSIQNPPNL